MNRLDNILEGIKNDTALPPAVHARVEETLLALPKQTAKGRRFFARGGRSLSAAAAMAALVLLCTVSVSAAVYRHWARSFDLGLRPSETQKEWAEDIGLAATPGNTALSGKDGTDAAVSCTDAGITVTAEQTIVDNYGALVSFRVEGFDLPEGAEPGFDEISVTVDGQDVPNWSAGFYNGLIMGADGVVTFDDGTPLPAEGAIERFPAPDGSLQYDLRMLNTFEEGYFLDKEITVRFVNMGLADKAEVDVTTEGEWTLSWRMTGTNLSRTFPCDNPLEDTGVRMVEAVVTPISFSATLVLPSYPEGFDELDEPYQLTGVRGKDGQLLPFLMDGGSAWLDDSGEALIYTQRYATDRILNVDDIDAMLFIKSYPEEQGTAFTEENFYIVPLN